MTTPTDEDGLAPGDRLSLADADHDEQLRQAIAEKLASLSPTWSLRCV